MTKTKRAQFDLLLEKLEAELSVHRKNYHAAAPTDDWVYSYVELKLLQALYDSAISISQAWRMGIYDVCLEHVNYLEGQLRNLLGEG